MCFYRRSEIPASLIPLADKHHWDEVITTDQDSDDEEANAETEKEKMKTTRRPR